MNLRSATSADLTWLRHWDEQPHVVASNPNDQWDWEVELLHNFLGREQLIAEINGRPIGFIEITDPARDDSNYWGDVAFNLRAIDIWIGEETDLGKGYGTKMMQLALKRCFADPLVTAVLVEPLASNTHAHRFYERLGFQFVEQRRFGNDECFVYRHFEQIGITKVQSHRTGATISERSPVVNARAPRSGSRRDRLVKKSRYIPKRLVQKVERMKPGAIESLKALLH